MAEKYAGNLAFTIQSDGDGVTGVMKIVPGMLNPFGTVHAGALIWFADVAATRLVFGERDVKQGAAGFPLAINLNAQLMGNRTEGTLTARARFVKRGRTVSTVRTRIAGDDGKVLVELTSTHVAAR